MIRSNRLKLLLIFIAQLFHKRYYSIKIDPIFACNLKCRMCYFSQSRKSESARFSVDEIDLIAQNSFKNALQVVVGCGAEPTMFKDFTHIIRKAKEHKVPNVSMVTNGQLLSYNQLEDMIGFGLDELILSIHGTTKEMYEKYMVGAKWETLIALLENLNVNRNNTVANSIALRINFTANPENYHELLTFFDVFGKYKINTLQVRPVMNIGGEYSDGFSDKNIHLYQEVILKLKVLCKLHGVQLLANIQNPTFTNSSKPNPVVVETYKYISPSIVIEKDFNWKRESYRQYQQRTSWRLKILRKVFFPKKQNTTDDFAERYSGQYDVF